MFDESNFQKLTEHLKCPCSLMKIKICFVTDVTVEMLKNVTFTLSGQFTDITELKSRKSSKEKRPSCSDEKT